MTGRLAAAEMLRRAQELLQELGSPAAFEILGAMRLLVAVRSPDTAEPEIDDDRDLAALAELEAVA